MSASQGEALRNRVTDASVDTGGHACCKLFIKAFTSGHLAELFLFLRRELLSERIRSFAACGWG